jgi:hypothetical protein
MVGSGTTLAGAWLGIKDGTSVTVTIADGEGN